MERGLRGRRVSKGSTGSLLQRLRNPALNKSLGERISSYYEFGSYESMEPVCVCVCGPGQN